MFADLAASQAALDARRDVYNDERPHEAIGYAVPAERYSPSSRHWRDTPEPWLYSEETSAPRQKKGEASLFGKPSKSPKPSTARTSPSAPHRTSATASMTHTSGTKNQNYRPHRLQRVGSKSVRDVSAQVFAMSPV